MRLSPEVEDALDSQEASSELLEVWAARQEQLNADSACRAPMQAAVRVGCLRFLHATGRVFGQSERGWLQAAAIFDLYCARSPMPEDELIAQAPAVCTAIVRLCAKVELSAAGRRCEGLSERASRFAQVLDVMGHHADACDDESINFAERRILEVLDWDLRVPSLEMWMSFLYRRFRVITRGMFNQSLSWAQGQCLVFARHIVCQRRHGGGGFCTRRVAEGIVALTLANAGVIPWQSLRPLGYSAEGWRGLVQRCQPTGVLPACNVEEPRLSLVLQILTFVSGRELETLRESCAVSFQAIDSALQATRQ